MCADTMRLVIPAIVLTTALALSSSNADAQAEVDVDLALVLAVDSSASIDLNEFDLQTGGLASAFRDPELISAIEFWAPRGVAVSVVLWSGLGHKQVAIDWTRIGDRASAEALATRIEAMDRGMSAETALGEGLHFAFHHLERCPLKGARRLIDISGDGRSNVGEDPDEVRDGAVAAGITINGLAILNDDTTLDRYCADHVIGGHDAFIMTTRDFEDFTRAMRSKLLQEIRGTPLG